MQCLLNSAFCADKSRFYFSNIKAVFSAIFAAGKEAGDKKQESGIS